jgi:hypothetical protein
VQAADPADRDPRHLGRPAEARLRAPGATPDPDLGARGAPLRELRRRDRGVARAARAHPDRRARRRALPARAA